MTEFETFSGWLRHEWKRPWLIATSIATAAQSVAHAYRLYCEHAVALTPWVPWLKVLPFALNFLICAIVCWNVHVEVPSHSNKLTLDPFERDILDRTMARFKQCWSMVWYLWGAAYFVKTVSALPMPKPLGVLAEGAVSGPISELTCTILMNGVTVGILLCYLTLLNCAKPKPLPIGRLIVASLVITTPELFRIIAQILYVVSPSAKDSSVDTLLRNWNIIDQVFGGLISAVTLSLFVGRLESRFIAPSYFLMLALYFYANLQVVGNLFQINPELTYATHTCYVLAALLKLLLFLFVAWLLRCGGLLFYILETIKAEKDLDQRRTAVVSTVLHG